MNAQICACRRLRILSLAQNHLTIMPDIFQLFTEMRVLDLRDNMLHSLPLTMLAIKHSLLALKLAHNQVRVLDSINYLIRTLRVLLR
jgi:hypothetical protein